MHMTLKTRMTRVLAILLVGVGLTVVLSQPVHADRYRASRPLPPRRVLTETEQREYTNQVSVGEAMLERGHLDAAVIALRRAIELDPYGISAYDAMGRTALRLQNWALAVQTYFMLIDLAPRDTKYHRVLLQITEAYNMTPEEQETLEKLLAVEPDDAAALRRLPQVYEMNSLPEKMFAAYDRLLAREPRNVELMCLVAEKYARLNRPRDAIRLYERVLAIEPESQVGLTRLGTLYSEVRSPVRMRAIYEKLLARNPGDADYTRMVALAHVYAGDAYAEQDLPDHARQEYDAAARIDPQNSLLGSRRQALDRQTRPRVDLEYQSGTTGINVFHIHSGKAMVHVPLGETRILVEHTQYTVADDQLRANANDTQIGVRYGIYRGLYVQAKAGAGSPGGSRSVTLGWQSPDVAADLTVAKRYEYETPLAVRTGLSYQDVSMRVNANPLPRLGVQGEFANDTYSDGVRQRYWVAGVNYAVLEDPSAYSLRLHYVISRLMNSAEVDPRLRFAPIDQLGYGRGVSWEHDVSPQFYYRLEYFDTASNLGRFTSYGGAAEYRITPDIIFGIEHTRGSGAGGRINPNSFNQSQDQQTRVNLRMRL